MTFLNQTIDRLFAILWFIRLLILVLAPQMFLSGLAVLLSLIVYMFTGILLQGVTDSRLFISIPLVDAVGLINLLLLRLHHDYVRKGLKLVCSFNRLLSQTIIEMNHVVATVIHCGWESVGFFLYVRLSLQRLSELVAECQHLLCSTSSIPLSSIFGVHGLVEDGDFITIWIAVLLWSVLRWLGRLRRRW